MINEAGEVARNELVDGVVAVGGGSVVDAAKGANVLIKHPLPISRHYLTFIAGSPLIAIPTTAGTGSESTSVAVITDSIKKIKTAVYTNASLAILDPELTLGISPELTVITGLDVLSHAAEAITAKEANPKSELLAYQAIKKVVKYLPVAYADGADIKARSNLLLADNFAGIAFNNALVHLGHAIAHSMGAAFHIPHGVACALSLPETMIYAAAVAPDKVRLVGEAMAVPLNGREALDEIGEQVAAGIRRFAKSLGIKSCAELGIKREALLAIADWCLPIPLPISSPNSCHGMRLSVFLAGFMTIISKIGLRHYESQHCRC